MTVILVEGESDHVTVDALLERFGGSAEVIAMGGATNVRTFATQHPGDLLRPADRMTQSASPDASTLGDSVTWARPGHLSGPRAAAGTRPERTLAQPPPRTGPHPQNLA